MFQVYRVNGSKSERYGSATEDADLAIATRDAARRAERETSPGSSAAFEIRETK